MSFMDLLYILIIPIIFVQCTLPMPGKIKYPLFSLYLSTLKRTNMTTKCKDHIKLSDSSCLKIKITKYLMDYYFLK